ncbi:MAG: hypothetical protein ACLU0T_01660 [Bacteroidales bacterium]
MIVATALCAVLAVPALAFGVGNLSAGQAAVASDAPAQTVAWRGYVDADGDGVCDNRGTGNGIGNGIGNGAGAHHGYGSSSTTDRPGYVDADGDGICDNRGSGNAGNGAGYVDADGDGVCDNYAGQGQGRGQGQGQGGGHHGGHGACNR